MSPEKDDLRRSPTGIARPSLALLSPGPADHSAAHNGRGRVQKTTCRNDFARMAWPSSNPFQRVIQSWKSNPITTP